MEQDTTMPSILGPQSGYGSGNERPTRDPRAAPGKIESRQSSQLVKLVFYVLVGIVVFGAYRFFAR